MSQQGSSGQVNAGLRGCLGFYWRFNKPMKQPAAKKTAPKVAHASKAIQKPKAERKQKGFFIRKGSSKDKKDCCEESTEASSKAKELTSSF